MLERRQFGQTKGFFKINSISLSWIFCAQLMNQKIDKSRVDNYNRSQSIINIPKNGSNIKRLKLFFYFVL